MRAGGVTLSPHGIVELYMRVEVGLSVFLRMIGFLLLIQNDPPPPVVRRRSWAKLYGFTIRKFVRFFFGLFIKTSTGVLMID